MNRVMKTHAYNFKKPMARPWDVGHCVREHHLEITDRTNVSRDGFGVVMGVQSELFANVSKSMMQHVRKFT